MTSGKVYLVGAGLGRLGNLSLAAYDCLQKADIIFYDRLINQNLLQVAPSSCLLVNVGKKPGKHSHSQEEITQQLIQASQEYQVIVHLKSGDPYLFGRGGEEAMALSEAGVDFAVIPGITSAIAGLAYAGIPATYRDKSSSLHIYTGQSRAGRTDLDYQAIVKSQGTAVFLMAVKALGDIVSGLIDAGMDEKTPMAAIEWAGRAQERYLVSDLGHMFDDCQAAQIKAPALFVLGEVVTDQQKLDFFSQAPLFGHQIAISAQTPLTDCLALEDLGADLIFYPDPAAESSRLELAKTALKQADIMISQDLLNPWQENLAAETLHFHGSVDDFIHHFSKQ
ncbi:uroporphyrinogen-III C-methyltransferase [Aerococcus sp. Group 2]|uniref:uroporphyrinogen-III C-methyltransferase n=1 Tax=Aerococcus sp. Group 2 TaxID=2976811 RepID=UPI00227BE6F8|nr:uroporphyrinogen-III C-methyltransferase [Aerococcus sp. Group 2]MCY3038850.1 uroporphyrinogen-III C-methyltransferase [Aerococcus sp. Group 2]MCY3042243.1 uroporphyrinogen-III C-methyltransferase [Aerococcus sp. Group 2]